MNRIIKLFSFVLLLLFVSIGCDCNRDNPIATTTINKVSEIVKLKTSEVKDYDYTKLFTISIGDTDIEVLNEYIDSSTVKEIKGLYFVSCTYEDITEKIVIEVYEVVTEINLSMNDIKLSVDEVEDYDFKSLFEVKVDDEIVDITAQMVLSTVKNVPGDYKVTVSLNGVSKTLNVSVYKPDVINIKVLQDNINVSTLQFDNFDYKTLFEIIVNDNKIPVSNDYLDLSSLKKEPGEYEIYCEYDNVKVSAKVIVIESTCLITAKVDEVTLNQNTVLDYDFKSLFIVKVDNEEVNILDEWIETNILPASGDYIYSVSYLGEKKEIIVHVLNGHTIEIFRTYLNIELYEDEIDTFDFTTLFTLYVDGKVNVINLEMLDLSELKDVIPDNDYQIKLNVKIDNTYSESNVLVTILPKAEINVSCKEITIYPNSELIDLTTLFEIRKGKEIIPVTMDMISGEINYNEIGSNEIILSYNETVYKAIVNVNRGVVISYTKSDTITILKGTDKDSYAFANDFKVTINGLVFDNIPQKFIDSSEVDFNNVGTYTCTIKIPYNDKAISLSGVKFTYYEKDIKYVVIENDVIININNDRVVINKSDLNYNVLNNIKVTINGRNQKLTNNPDYVDIITCYVKVTSPSIDFNKTGVQIVTIEVYGNGIDNDPEIVNFELVIDSEIVLEGSTKVIFSNEEINPIDLFKIKKSDEDVEILPEYITGLFNCSKPGVYEIYLNYEGLEAVSKLVVINSELLGTYETDLSTIPVEEDDDEDDYYGDSEYYTMSNATSSSYDKLIFESIDKLTVNGNKVTIIDAIDENTLRVKMTTNIYTLYYKNGIIVLDPDNSIKLSFTDNKRPLIYFKESVYEITDKVVINYGSSYVLSATYTNYSIDCFRLTTTDYSKSIWYGLMVNLVEKNSADTIYKVSWGEVVFDESFEKTIGTYSSLTFNDETYNFMMVSDSTGKVNVETSNLNSFANKNFTGMIDNDNVEIRFDYNEGVTIYINNTKKYTISKYLFDTYVYGGLDKVNNYLLIYDYTENYYSYKFKLNDDSTFDYISKDLYYGYYLTDGMYLFFDGYGKGIANFDTSSYYRTEFKYDVYNNNVNITFLNTLPTFKYGDGMVLSVDKLLNVLTVKESFEDIFNGLVFENKYIIDGAIIHIDSLKVGQGSDKVAKNEFYNKIEIITKDGILSDDKKKEVITTKFIKFNTPGYYEFSISLDVNGEQVTNYYAIEILEALYENNPFVNHYGQGIINNSNSLIIDKYGQVQLYLGETLYKGMAIINDNILRCNATDGQNSIDLYMVLLEDNIISVRCTGYSSFVDIYSTGENRLIGADKTYIREIKCGNNYTYVLCNSLDSIGTIVTCESLNGIEPYNNGSIVKIINGTSELYLTFNEWNNQKSGIIFSDGYRGDYTSLDGDNIFVDGFNTISIGANKYSYTISGSYLTFIRDESIIVYRLDKENFTYTIINFVLNYKSFLGKTFSQTYKFTCGIYTYEATTSFVFNENGTVSCISTSESHDDYEQGCIDDTYEASFAKKGGSKGTYVISVNKIIVNIEGYTFEFLINNVLTIDEITTLSTDLDSSSHGYFKPDTVFTNIN